MVIETNIEDFANLKFHKDIFPFMNNCISNFHYIYECEKVYDFFTLYISFYTQKENFRNSNTI